MWWTLPQRDSRRHCLTAQKYVTFKDLLRRSDFVSLHCPLPADNQKLIHFLTNSK